MKKLASFLFSAALASSVLAGPPSPSGKEITPPTVDNSAFAAGAAYGIYGGAYIDHQSAAGGGVLGEYFFCPNFGIQGSYGAFATSSTHHEFDGAFVLRFPFKSFCVAPYAMTGGGFSVNSSTHGNYFVGGGVEGRIAAAHYLGVFADGAYHFSADGKEDYTLVRLGVKFPF